MSEYWLATATLENLNEVINWFGNQEELTQWGGPDLAFGLTLTEFAEQIRFSKLPSYCLVAENKICGFGQFYIRLGRHHFGRLAISPKLRGKGLGRVLLRLLMEEALQQQTAEGFSLFVLEHNTSAVRTYESLGFEFTQYPEAIPGGLENCGYMVLDR